MKKRPEGPRVLGSVYAIDRSQYSWCYIGESGRVIQERWKEHHRAVRELDVQRSEVARHSAESNHDVDVAGMRILEKESNWRKRVVKEAIWMKRLQGSNKIKHELGDAWTI